MRVYVLVTCSVGIKSFIGTFDSQGSGATAPRAHCPSSSCMSHLSPSYTSRVLPGAKNRWGHASWWQRLEGSWKGNVKTEGFRVVQHRKQNSP